MDKANPPLCVHVRGQGGLPRQLTVPVGLRLPVRCARGGDWAHGQSCVASRVQHAALCDCTRKRAQGGHMSGSSAQRHSHRKVLAVIY